MTETARKLITELEEAIQRLPEEEQEDRIAAYLADAKRRQKEQDAEFEPYSSFTFLEGANLDLPADYSETYEDHLYGKRAAGDE